MSLSLKWQFNMTLIQWMVWDIKRRCVMIADETIYMRYAECGMNLKESDSKIIIL